MTKIKVCGLRRLEDVEYANDLRPDYVGFIFAKSKRQITKEQARKLRKSLDKEILTVGIFVNEAIGNLLEILDFVDLDVLQLHGDEDERYIEKLRQEIKNNKVEIWKVVRVKDLESVEKAKKFKVDGLLLDSYSKEAYGGIGESFDWNIVKNLKIDKKLILAGGLDEDNVCLAKEMINPDILDVSSGVEVKGYKNYEKIKRFIERGR